MDRFALDIAKFATLTAKKVDQVLRSVVMDLSTKIIWRTPVDTGRARTGWNASIGSPDHYTPPKGAYPPGIEYAKLARAAQSLTTKNGDVTFYLTNNVPYILPLEHGHSQQAPSGMVKITLSEFPGIVRMASSSARGGGGTY